jgi:CRISPR system Cascade subunit CasB
MTQPETTPNAPSPAASTLTAGERDQGFLLCNEVRRLAEAEQRGDLAELRRLDPNQPGAPAFFRILARVAPEAGGETMRRYAHFLRILALKPEALSGDRLGAVMAKAGVSESRVQRLLTARGETMRDQLRLIARRLANSGNLPWRGFADLLLTKDDKQAENKRLIIARDYWRALDRAEAQS